MTLVDVIYLQVSEPSYSYTVRVYGGSKRKYYVRELYGVTERFSSIERLIDVVSAKLHLSFPQDVGYFESRNNSKRWLVCNEDLEAMYSKFTRDVPLWYEEELEEENTSRNKRKRKSDSDDEPVSAKKKRKKSSDEERRAQRVQKEEDCEDTFLKLKERHGDLLTDPQYRLWARAMTSGIHDDWETPPALPLITGKPPKKPKQESLVDAVTGAATAVVNVLRGTATPTKSSPSASVSSQGISPGRAADVRMKNLEQLRYVQQLLDDGIITSDEFFEQKTCILESLRKITK